VITEYRARLAPMGEVTVMRDPVAEVVRIEIRDAQQRTIVELPDGSCGPEFVMQLTNALIRVLDEMGYGGEVVLPEIVGGPITARSTGDGR